VDLREGHLHFAGAFGVGLDLPARRDVPCEEQTVRGLEREHTAPIAGGSVDTTVVDAAARARLEDRLRNLLAQEVVLPGFDAIELAGEHVEGSIDAHGNVN